jgi:hypothetical protein
MKIELKNVKHAKFASEETECFAATVWIDGKKVGEVSNDGKGGAHEYRPWALADQIGAYAKTLPPVVCNFIDRNTGKKAVMPQSADGLIDDVFYDWQSRKLIDAELKNRLVWRETDGRIYRTAKLSAQTLATALANPADTLKKMKIADGQLLNLLAREEAHRIYKNYLSDGAK